MMIILRRWTTCPHVYDIVLYAEKGTTNNVPYAEFSQTRQKQYTAAKYVQPDDPGVSSAASANYGWAFSSKPDLGTPEATNDGSERGRPVRE